VASQQFSAWLEHAASLFGEGPTEVVVGGFERSDEETARAIEREAPAAWCWIRWWLGMKSLPAVSVPIAAVRNHTLAGSILNLQFYRMAGDKPSLIRHPSCALDECSPRWLEPLERLHGTCLFPVCWEVEQAESSPVQRSFDGNSAGGAVARAFYHLAKDMKCDPGVLVLASIEKWAGWNPEKPAWEALQLAPVGMTSAKIAAAQGSPPPTEDDSDAQIADLKHVDEIDTIVVATISGNLHVHRRIDHDIWKKPPEVIA
jgi:hypothetical protein